MAFLPETTLMLLMLDFLEDVSLCSTLTESRKTFAKSVM